MICNQMGDLFFGGRFTFTVVSALAILLESGCHRSPEMTELLPRYSLEDTAAIIPLIVVGQITEAPQAAGPVVRSRQDGTLCQLRRVKVRVEHVIQGTFRGSELRIYYFLFTSRQGEWLMSLQPGEFDVFFLQNDGDRWRTICDGWRNCVWQVRTGAHPNYVFEPRAAGPEWDPKQRQIGSGPASFKGTALKENIVNLLLSRGPATKDEQMVDAIRNKPSRLDDEPFAKKLAELARTESPPVRKAACDMLKGFGKACSE